MCVFASTVTSFAKDISYQIIEDQSALHILTPSLSDRKTLKLRLENGLSAYLISDPGTHQSGAALAVAVGSWEDPKERPGMAHFVEHMLFLGTEKYPDEEGYQRYIDEYGGDRNAYTAADRTVYMFTVANEGFEGALDRFAQFFISPLFDPSGVERESKAIDQEYCKNLPIDAWRVMHVRKELANPEHPFHTFSMGNKQTLAYISQDELKEWYASHYSANLMHLVVYSPLPIEELEKNVVGLFSQVKNKNCKFPPTQASIFLSGSPKLVTISPVQHLQNLDLSWELPHYCDLDKQICADEILSFVIGHEGEGSLLSLLKKEGLADGLRTGSQHAGKNQSLFTVSIQLTSKGLAQYETVIQKCFEALAALKTQGIPKYIYDEIVNIKTLSFAFQERLPIFDCVTDLASQMVDEPLETFPRRSLMPTIYDDKKIHNLLGFLTPEKCLYTLVAPPQQLKTKLSKKERWMGVPYAVSPIAEKKLTAWSKAKPHQAISVPSPNRFLPKALDVTKEIASHAKGVVQPKLIIDDERSKIYYSKDTRFGLPHIAWNFTFKTPSIKDSDVPSQILADLYCHAVDEHLTHISYDAQLAGLSYSLKPTHNGLKFKVQGFGEKAADFSEVVLKTMHSLKPSPESFALYKELAEREYMNASNKTPITQGFEVLWGILYKDYASISEKAKQVSQVTYEQFVTFCSQVWKEAFVEGMMYGSLHEEDALVLAGKVPSLLGSLPYTKEKHFKVEMASLPQQKDPSILSKNSSLPGNALIFAVDCGDFSFKRRAAQEILTKGLEEPFFTELRTKQQTGYLIANFSQEMERHLYSVFLVQSSTHDARDLLARFELFFENTLQNFSSQVIPESRFDSIKMALITALEHPAEHMSKMSETLHILGFDYDDDFTWLEKRIEGLKQLTYEEFKRYTLEFLGKDNRRRLAICVNGSLPAEERFHYRKMTNLQKLRKEISYSGREKLSTTAQSD